MISIIIVTWNCKEEVMNCLRSLAELRNLPADLQTIVVDNGSEDGTRELLQASSSRFLDVGLEVTYNSKNVGLSSATQQAYHEARGDLILLCNPDITFNDNVRRLVAYGLSHPNEMITTEMVNRDGTLQRVIHRRFATVTRVFFDFSTIGTYLDEKFMNHLVRKNYTYQNEILPLVAAIEQPGASFLLFNRGSLDKVGVIFDLGFPVWWNDVDLARRAEKAGIQRTLLSDVKVEHGLGRSGSRKMPSGTQWYVFCRSMLLYARKWKMHPHILKLLFCADAILSVPLTAVVQSRTRGILGVVKKTIPRAAAQMSGVLGS
jgi:GT2 family glycosyltransferase